MMRFIIEFVGYIQEVNDNESSSGDEFMAEGSPINQNKNNDDDNDAIDMDVNELNEEEKQNSHIDSAIIVKPDGNDDKSPQMDESPT
ncbi:unnamed protein product [Adineta ricciae]|uniref:Uncharacterized protein n=1 Tax=Adineta ricciae TaxID=249248 RepID=A0A816C8H1_ADIRI|nr:unnamed protein product [Adineta ricciae]CAF1619801.1 unnamed protein product [Adineta ricciae]